MHGVLEAMTDLLVCPQALPLCTADASVVGMGVRRAASAWSRLGHATASGEKYGQVVANCIRPCPLAARPVLANASWTESAFRPASMPAPMLSVAILLTKSGKACPKLTRYAADHCLGLRFC